MTFIYVHAAVLVPILLWSCLAHDGPDSTTTSVPLTNFPAVGNTGGLFDLKESAMLQCALQFGKNSSEFLRVLPTGILTQGTNTYNFTYNAILDVCDGAYIVDDFIACLNDNKNMSTSVDQFEFTILSLDGLKEQFKQICQEVQVLKDNVHCLTSGVSEVLLDCYCYLLSLSESFGRLGNTNDVQLMVKPYCSFYNSFTTCMTNHIKGCNSTLSSLLNDFYMGSITQQCRNTSRAPCSKSVTQLPIIPELIKCTRDINRHTMNTLNQSMSGITARNNTAIDTRDALMESARYTCRAIDNMTSCLAEKVVPSTHQMDKIILMMFDRLKIPDIKSKACVDELLEELEQNMDCLMMDPSIATCVSSMGIFESLVTSEVLDPSNPNVTDPFCMAWGQMVECLHATLTCCSAKLANHWNEWSMEILASRCMSTAQQQREAMKIEDPKCAAAVFMCSRPYVISIQARHLFDPLSNLEQISQMVMNEILYFCQHGEAERMSTCLADRIPMSKTNLDKVLNRVYDVSKLHEIYSEACGLLSELSTNILCLTDKVRQTIKSCFINHRTEFHVAEDITVDIDSKSTTFCRAWGGLLDCWESEFKACSPKVGNMSRKLGTKVVSAECQEILYPGNIGDGNTLSQETTPLAGGENIVAPQATTKLPGPKNGAERWTSMTAVVLTFFIIFVHFVS